MKTIWHPLLIAAVVSSSGFMAAGTARALPELDLVKSISVDGKLLQYMPDSEDPSAFYFLPQDIELVIDDAGNPRIGFQHWGITKKDPAGVGGNFTLMVQPAWDEDLVAKATELLRTQQNDPNASLSVVPIEKSYFDVVMTQNFVSDPTYVVPPALLDDYTIRYSQTLKDLGVEVTGVAGQDQTKFVLESVSGSGGTGPQAFTIPLNELGGRLSVETPNTLGGDAANMVIRYRFLVKGVTPKFRAELTVHWKKTFEHFHARVGGGGWFWRSSHVVDIQEMKQDGSIELKVTSGAVDDKNETLINSIFETLVNSRINGTGMFAPQLRPAAVGDGEAAGSLFGWSFNSNSFFQKLSEEVNQTFVIDRQNIQHRSFAIGADFGPLCAVHPDQFVNLSDPDRPCPNSKDIASLIERTNTCVEDYGPKLQAAKPIGEDYYQALFTKMRKECGV